MNYKLLLLVVVVLVIIYGTYCVYLFWSAAHSPHPQPRSQPRERGAESLFSRTNSYGGRML